MFTRIENELKFQNLLLLGKLLFLAALLISLSEDNHDVICAHIITRYSISMIKAGFISHPKELFNAHSTLPAHGFCKFIQATLP